MQSRTRQAFTLIEVLIVVVIMAVLAATIIPQFSSSTRDAQENTARFNAHTMRSQIELYKAHHLGTLPSIGDLPTKLTSATNAQGTVGATGTSFPFGPYMDEIPMNPFNNRNDFAAGTGAAGTGESGWQYDASTGGVWPNHTGYTPITSTTTTP